MALNGSQELTQPNFWIANIMGLIGLTGLSESKPIWITHKPNLVQPSTLKTIKDLCSHCHTINIIKININKTFILNNFLNK